MAKRTAIIDIGSNSARMVVFEKTSRFGFHLIKEIKSRVRIGEGAYKIGGKLQAEPMKRAYEALSDFVNIAKNLKCKKTLCVATSALRDAPNAKEFTNKCKKELNLNIRVINGEQEAYFGGIATLNLLPSLKEAVTVDIGGGSTELAKIENGKVVDKISLDIGTVRLKELFFDTKKSLDEVARFLDEFVEKIPFSSKTVFGIGGTIRAISRSIMDKELYPLPTVHGFEYEYKKYEDYIKTIASSGVLKLKSYPFKKDRYDTIREGSFIFYKIAEKLNIQKIVTSGAGVREGVYLQDLLRSINYAFPPNFNPSVRSLMDRFIDNPKDSAYISTKAMKLFDVLKPLHGMEDKYKNELSVAGKLCNVGMALSFYQHHIHSYHFILSNLNFGFSHNQKMLIALLIKSNAKKLPAPDDLRNYDILLPSANTMNWLSFILSFAKNLNIDFSKPHCEFEFRDNILFVKSKKSLKLAKEAIEKLVKPASFAIIF